MIPNFNLMVVDGDAYAFASAAAQQVLVWSAR